MKTTCPYCGVGCGIDVTLDDDAGISVAGDPVHPANFGRLCSKGSALADTLTDSNRLLSPSIDGQPVSWDQATDHIAQNLTDVIQQYGRDAIAFYVSGQLLTEDYYVANKFVKGWLGNANIDTNSRLCMASSVVGHKRAFGSDTVPGCYEDLDLADLIILVGSNLAWCHPVLFQRILAEKERRPELCLVVVDPRRTMTADAADIHLAIQPDTDAFLFNGLIRYLSEHQCIDQAFVDQYVTGLDETLAEADDCSVVEVARVCGVDEHLLKAFYQLVSQNQRTVTVYSQGVNQSIAGTDKVNAIINCHLATGRIGKPGMGPFSVTGQPNAMGGREVGGLATMLAAHMELQNPEHRDIVQNFWQSPFIADKPGPCAVDLFRAVADGNIKAIWIMGTNPVDSLPDADAIKAALDYCPLVIVSDVAAQTDTLMHADVCLPAHAWGEKDGTVTNSERCVSRQRRIKSPVGQARADWWAISRVAQKMGFGNAFDYSSPAEIFREFATLSGVDNAGARDFNISACSTLDDTQYQHLLPFYWPWVEGLAPATAMRFFAKGQFYTPDRRARLLPISTSNLDITRTNAAYPLVLNTGRNRDQWHTMTRTGYSARLSQHLAEPYVAIHPQDALAKDIRDADLVSVSSDQSTVLVRALLTDRQQVGHLFIPLHWSDQFASNARVDTLFSNAVDPHSKQPGSKYQAVSIKRHKAKTYVYGLMRNRPTLRSLYQIHYWAIAPVDHGWQIEAASDLSASETLNLLMSNPDDKTKKNIERLSYDSGFSRRQSAAEFNGSKLQTLAFTDSQPVEVSRAWIQQKVTNPIEEKSKRWQLLTGRPCAHQVDKGAIVCSCHSVGANEIRDAIISKGCQTVYQIGETLQAGTHCGSCRSEIQSILGQLELTESRMLA